MNEFAWDAALALVGVCALTGAILLVGVLALLGWGVKLAWGSLCRFGQHPFFKWRRRRAYAKRMRLVAEGKLAW